MMQEKETQITYIVFTITVLLLLCYMAASLPRNVIIVVDGSDWALKACAYIGTACLVFICYEKWPEVKNRIKGLVAPTYFSLMNENEKRKSETQSNRRRIDNLNTKVDSNTKNITEITDNEGHQR